MSTPGTVKMTRAQRRAAARRAAKPQINKRIQPVIVEPPTSGLGRAIKALGGHTITKWETSCPEIKAKSSIQITIPLPSELSSERNKVLKVGRVLLWLGLLPSINGQVKACVTQTNPVPGAAFQSALAIADSSKEVVSAMYVDIFKGITIEDFVNDLAIYVYSAVDVAAKDIIVHLEVEHVRPVLDDYFTPLH
ncbi:coat protein [Melandrium yellow fleck virus]|uniref:Coat protein n=1 Tax=Melandrium yellow fleck virus TaxID=545259 RepID=C8KH78_9BROM|nr:coat protein [Melandrium yellow fleck virus]BAI40164.1 coat protein [Melandrium yellow fleck virus]